MKTLNKKNWTRSKHAVRTAKDPMIYKCSIIGGGMKVATVYGVGEDHALFNADLIVHAVNKMTVEEIKELQGGLK